MSPQSRGVLVIISSPSGAGKTTLARRLLNEFSSMEFSVSFTTRSPRKNERDRVDYHFVSDATFDRMVAEHAFAEWAHVHGNRYGTSREAVEKALREGRDVVFDVDWQGGRALSASWPRDCLTIFILPPDWPTLASRLRSRATDSEEVILQRLRKAREELEHHNEYQYLILNADLDLAYERLRSLYLASRDGDTNPVDENQDEKLREHAMRLVRIAREGSIS